MHLRETHTEGELRVHAVDAADVRVGDEGDLRVTRNELAEAAKRAALDPDPGGGEHDVVGVAYDGVRRRRVQGTPLVVEAAELRLVLRERAVAAANP